MGRWALLLVASVVLDTSSAVRFLANDEEVTVSSRPRLRHDNALHSQSREWIDGPDGRVYQFHVGEQSWLAAREFCLSQNSELVVLRSKEQIDWLLTHYAPTYARFSERYMQVGLMMPDGPNRDWTYLDGSKYNKSVISWISGEPFDHSVDGRERCAILRVHARILDDVDCEAAPGTNTRMRFVCEREQDVHKKQQKSQNFIWSKLEKLLEYFGFAGNATTPTTPSNNSDYDYIDEVKKINITSKEIAELKNVKVDQETSSEEQTAVESALNTLNKVSKPGRKAVEIPEAETEETSVSTSREDRSDSSSELLTGSATSSTTSSISATSEATIESSEAEATTDEATDTSTVPETTEELTTVLSSTSASSEGSASKERSPKKSKAKTFKLPKDEAARVHAAPLKEIDETEGSGVEMEKSEIEKASKLQNEIDPDKLEKVINTMEKMIENLEKIQVKEPKSTEEKKEEERKEPEKKEEKKKEASKKKTKSKESLVKISQRNHDDREVANEMEKDFDEEASKTLPSTDIKPPEEECDEDASGETESTPLPNDEVLRNSIDTEDVDDLSQKPKIPVEKEAHIQDFLATLRMFLSRAEHSDLKKLLDEQPEKTLLEKMKLAIKAANDREFERMKELELMKKHGVDISNVPEPKLMGESEREELYNKISRVVMVEAEKKDETATQASVRTTTQELHGSTAKKGHDEGVLLRQKSSEEFIAKKKKKANEGDTKLKDVTPIANQAEKAEGEEKKVEKKEQNEEKKTEPVKREEKKEEEKVEEKKEKKSDKNHGKNKDEKQEEQKEENTAKSAEAKKEEEKDEKKEEDVVATTAKFSAEVPVRTVQLKEFEDKKEVMSLETKIEELEDRAAGIRRPKEDSSSEERPVVHDRDYVKTVPITDEDLKNEADDDEEEKTTEVVKNDEDDDEDKSKNVKVVKSGEHDDEDKSTNVKAEPIKPFAPEKTFVSEEEGENDIKESTKEEAASTASTASAEPTEPTNSTGATTPEDTPDDTDTDVEDDSFDSDQVDRSALDNDFDSSEVDGGDLFNGKDDSREEEIVTTRIPPGENDDDGEEVATVKTPERVREEKRRLEKEKRKKERQAKAAAAKTVRKPGKAGKKADSKYNKANVQDDDEEEFESDDDSKSEENPLGLPTLPTLPPLGQPLPTLPPLTPPPGFDKMLQTISEHWRSIFPSAKIPTFKEDG